MKDDVPGPGSPRKDDSGACEGPEDGRGARLWRTLVASRSLRLPVAVAGFTLALSLWTAVAVLQKFPNSADEYAYLVSAELFARARMAAPSPPEPRFFDVTHVVNDGAFYGKYPPGWPALLAAGVLVGAPWILNPILGALTVVVVYGFARRQFSVESANLAVLALAANPFLILNSASYFSHPACLLSLTAALWAMFEHAERPSTAKALGAGLSAGLAFLIRPFTAVAILGPAAVYAAARAVREGRRARALGGLGAALLPLGLCLGLFLAYNHAQTGSAWVQPFERYDPSDRPALPEGAEWGARASSHLFGRLAAMMIWVPLSPLYAVLACARPGTRGNPRIRCLAAVVGALVLAYFFYWGEGGFQYGPRYLYEALSALAVLTGAVIASFGRRGVLMLLAVALLNVALFARASSDAADQVAAKQDLYVRVREQGLSGAIVFVATNSGPAPARDCLRNGVDFDASVIYALDRGAQNARLLEAFPGRTGWRYEWDAASARGRLTPWPREGR